MNAEAILTVYGTSYPCCDLCKCGDVEIGPISASLGQSLEGIPASSILFSAGDHELLIARSDAATKMGSSETVRSGWKDRLVPSNDDILLAIEQDRLLCVSAFVHGNPRG